MKVNCSVTSRNSHPKKGCIHLNTVIEERMCHNKMITPKLSNKGLTKDTNSDVQSEILVLRSVSKLTSKGELQRNLVNCKVTFEENQFHPITGRKRE